MATPTRIAQVARTEILPRLQALEGVSAADLTGGSTPLLDIVLDPAAMAEHGISLQQVQGILFANQITLPSGSLDDGELRLPVSTSHAYRIGRRSCERQIVGASTPAGQATTAPSSGAGRGWREPGTDEPAATRRVGASSVLCPTWVS